MAEYIEREVPWDDQYISKTDAIKLAAIIVVPFATSENIQDIHKAFERTIDKYPAADVQPVKWIPVAERLPEEYKDVLCYYEYFRFGDFNCMFRTIDRGYYGNGIWGGEAGQGHKNKVLAWMPLPKPPKGDNP